MFTCYNMIVKKLTSSLTDLLAPPPGFPLLFCLLISLPLPLTDAFMESLAHSSQKDIG